MAKDYASKAPREEVAPPPALLPEHVCIICKRRPAGAADGFCAECSAALSSG